MKSPYCVISRILWKSWGLIHKRGKRGFRLKWCDTLSDCSIWFCNVQRSYFKGRVFFGWTCSISGFRAGIEPNFELSYPNEFLIFCNDFWCKLKLRIYFFQIKSFLPHLKVFYPPFPHLNQQAFDEIAIFMILWCIHRLEKRG